MDKNTEFHVEIPFKDKTSIVRVMFSSEPYSKIREPEVSDYFIHLNTENINEKNNIDELNEILSYIEDMTETFYRRKDSGKPFKKPYKIKIKDLNFYIRNEHKQPLLLNNLIVIFENLHEIMIEQIELTKKEIIQANSDNEEINEHENTNNEDEEEIIIEDSMFHTPEQNDDDKNTTSFDRDEMFDIPFEKPVSKIKVESVNLNSDEKQGEDLFKQLMSETGFDKKQ